MGKHIQEDWEEYKSKKNRRKTKNVFLITIYFILLIDTKTMLMPRGPREIVCLEFCLI